MAKVGFIGLGSQGAPMARRIIEAGHDVVLWARNSKTLEPFAESGAHFASGIAELAEQADHVGICVVDDAGVTEICDQLIPAMHSGGCIMIHSTVAPGLCMELAKRANSKGIELLDAPVSGGGHSAEEGTLTVMVGGSESILATVRPILECFAGKIVLLGDVGSGQNAKLINNTLMAAHVAIAHHGLRMAESLSMSKSALAEIVSVSSGRSFGFDVYARQATPSDFKHGAKLLLKDISLLDASLAEKDDILPIRELTVPLMESIIKADQ